MENKKEPKILIIDDSDDFLTVVEAVLKKRISNIQVFTSLSGQKGIEIAEKEKPDVILLDIVMPDMDGFETCLMLKVNALTKYIPIIMITGFKNENNCRTRALECGADAFLSKPFLEAELTAQVKSMLRLKHAEDQLREEVVRHMDIINQMQLGLHVYHFDNPEDDHSLKFVAANPAAEKITGIKQHEIIGKFIDEAFPMSRQKNIPQIYAEVIRSGRPIEIEDFFYSDSRVNQAHFSVRAFPLPHRHVGILFEDISARIQAEIQVKKSLHEKELMLREIHHRIKNNLAMVSSLLNMQSRCLTDEISREAFKKSRKRINSIALLHEKLYRSPDFINVDFVSYARELINILAESTSFVQGRVQLLADVTFTLNIDTAIPLGLIITELVTNAEKHGTLNDGKVTVTIREKKPENQIVLTISDTGPGFPPHIDWKNTQTLGLQLVILLTDQLHGHIEMEQNNGITFTITIPYPNHLQ